MVKCEYDPWGKCTIVSDTSENNLGKLNPFRYRGYYYDEETGLYYLQSRYYDCNTCKFINADDPSILLADPFNVQCVHIYDYCNNNPVMNVDSDGYISIPFLAKGLVKAGAVKFRLSITMYMYSVRGSHYKDILNLSSTNHPIAILLRNRLYNSKLISYYIKWMIKSKKWYNRSIFYFGGSGGNSADMDLSMSVGHAQMSFYVRKTNQKKYIYFGKTKYIVTIILLDKYDFALFSKKNAGFIKRTINNYLGYWSQTFNIIKPYHFNIYYSFNYYY